MPIGTPTGHPRFKGQTLPASYANSFEDKLSYGAQCSVGPWPSRGGTPEPHVFTEGYFKEELTSDLATDTSFSPWITNNSHKNSIAKGTFRNGLSKIWTINSYAQDWLLDAVETPATSNNEICTNIVGNGTGGSARVQFAWRWDVSTSIFARITIPPIALIDGANLFTVQVFMLRSQGSTTPAWTANVNEINVDGTIWSSTPGSGTLAAPETSATTTVNRTIDKTKNYFLELTMTGSPVNLYGIYRMQLVYSSTRNLPYVRSYA